MKAINLPKEYNYAACFLTLACNLKCDYCLNYLEKDWEKHHLSADDWVRCLNRIELPGDIPLTIQGGEPTLHKGFYEILQRLKPELKIDLLTNGYFDPDEFISKLDPARFKKNELYPSIRISYHPSTTDINLIVDVASKLLKAEFPVGIWGVEDPRYLEDIFNAEKICKGRGVEYRTKEVLGLIGDKFYGTFKYVDSCTGKFSVDVSCKTSELLIGPLGYVYQCHSYLYSGTSPIGNITDHNFDLLDSHRDCDIYGACNPCDVKLKTNRLQQFGHASVDIKFKSDDHEKLYVREKGWCINESPQYRVGGVSIK